MNSSDKRPQPGDVFIWAFRAIKGVPPSIGIVLQHVHRDVYDVLVDDRVYTDSIVDQDEILRPPASDIKRC